jgi:glutamyl-tRNA reductase
MTLCAVGLSHHTAPLPLRERLAAGVSLEEIAAAGIVGTPELAEVVVLQTCNRTELYAAGEAPGAPERLAHHLAAVSGASYAELANHLFVHTEAAAVRHLMAVATGLDSLILGEAQILGQVRAALEAAQAERLAGPRLAALFTAAVRAGRRARRESGIGRGAASVPSAAVALACAGLAPAEVARRRVVVVGAGKMGLLATRTLLDHGVHGVVVSNRSPERAQALADQWGGRAVPFELLGETVTDADIVITSTGAPHAILTHELVSAAMARRPERSLTLVDIAVPRDVAPEVAQLPGVRLYGLEDLATVVADNLAERAAAVPLASAIVDEEAERFGTWLHQRQASDTVAALHRWADELRERELARHLRRLGELSERDQDVVRALSVALVGKLLHPATAQLKNGGGPEYAALVASLFDLSLPTPVAPATAEDPG